MRFKLMQAAVNKRFMGRMIITKFLVDILNTAGIAGLILTMAIEGLSIPLPGIIVVLTLGCILNLNIVEMLLISIAMSLTYSIASCIPYRIGYKLGDTVKKKYEKQIETVQRYFSKFGEYSIALLRPLAIGNYISYIAGMSKTKLWRYILFTFIGIFPWCFIILLIGRISRGSISSAIKLVKSYSGHVCVLIIIILACTVWTIYRRTFSRKSRGQVR